MTRRAGVVGSPVAHSRSPALHRAAYAALGLRWTYDAYDVPPEAFPAFVAAQRRDPAWAGLSVTMPHKAAALDAAGTATPLAVAVGGANTLVPLGDGRLAADTTDVAGLAGALRAALAGAGTPRSAAVLGGGATARAAVAALAEVLGRGASVTVAVRSPGRAAGLRATARQVGCAVETLDWSSLERALGADVVVCTVPAGAWAGGPPLVAAPPGSRLLLDVGYDPWPTPLAAAWERAGAGPVAGGLEVLVRQAVPQLAAMLAAAGEAVPDDLGAAVGPAMRAVAR